MCMHARLLCVGSCESIYGVVVLFWEKKFPVTPYTAGLMPSTPSISPAAFSPCISLTPPPPSHSHPSPPLPLLPQILHAGDSPSRVRNHQHYRGTGSPKSDSHYRGDDHIPKQQVSWLPRSVTGCKNTVCSCCTS